MPSSKRRRFAPGKWTGNLDLRRRFLQGPVLIQPVGNEFRFTFDPNRLLPLDDSSVVYGSLRVTDSWGTLEADGGGLMVRENGLITRVVVPAPPPDVHGRLAADGWKLDLKEGFADPDLPLSFAQVRFASLLLSWHSQHPIVTAGRHCPSDCKTRAEDRKG